jgi:small subunit ribosomal protein S19e
MWKYNALPIFQGERKSLIKQLFIEMSVQMVSTLDINTNALIDAAKEELKTVEALKKPEWAHYAKSGAHKERPPQNDDFWQIRAAALMRKLYKKGPIGVSRLRKEYGGRKNRGAKPEKHYDGSGNVIRTILQQLETAGYVKKVKGGRELTATGMKFLDGISHKVENLEQDSEKAPIENKKEVAEEKIEVPEAKEDKTSEE